MMAPFIIFHDLRVVLVLLFFFEVFAYGGRYIYIKK